MQVTFALLKLTILSFSTEFTGYSCEKNSNRISGNHFMLLFHLSTTGKTYLISRLLNVKPAPVIDWLRRYRNHTLVPVFLYRDVIYGGVIDYY